VQVQRS